METENISGCEEHQELCILSLRHGQFTVSSALLLTRFVNLQAIEKNDIYMNKMGRHHFYHEKSFPLIMWRFCILNGTVTQRQNRGESKCDLEVFKGV